MRKAIVSELKKFDPELAARPRWLVLNKMDLLLPEEAIERATKIVRALRFKGPVFLISGATGEGTRPLVEAVMHLLEDLAAGREPQVKGAFEVALPRAVKKVAGKALRKPAARRVRAARK